MITRLLWLLNGGEKQSLLELLKSDLKRVAVFFLIALGSSTTIFIFTPEPHTKLDANKSQLIDL